MSMAAHIADTAAPDGNGFGHVYPRYHEELLRAALRLTAHRCEAEDMVQEAALRAWASWDRSQVANRRAWLHRVLRNTYIDHFRRRQREAGALHELQQQREQLADVSQGVSVSAHDGWGDEVHVALQRLPEAARAVIGSVDIAGDSYEEVAEAMQCPLGTVMSRLFRARRRLHSELSDYAATMGYLPQAA